jgi:hypothetical protein
MVRIETHAKAEVFRVFSAAPTIAQSITGHDTLVAGNVADKGQAQAHAHVPAMLGPCPILGGESVAKSKAAFLTFTRRGGPQGPDTKTLYVSKPAAELVRMLHGACFMRAYCVGKLQAVLVAMDSARLGAAREAGQAPAAPAAGSWHEHFAAMVLPHKLAACSPETGTRPPITGMEGWTCRDLDTVRAAMGLLSYSILAWHDTIKALQ